MARPLNLACPKFSRTLGTLWSIDSQKNNITKFHATTCQILRPKCTKLDFRWSSALDADGGAYSAPPGPMAVFEGAYFKGMAGEEGGEGRKREGERKRRGK